MANISKGDGAMTDLVKIRPVLTATLAELVSTGFLAPVIFNLASDLIYY
jgi:hypothetical protein